MKKIQQFLIVVFSFCCINGSFAQDIERIGRIEREDAAIFRVKNQVFFYSDLEQIIDDLKIFTCLNDSYLLLSANLSTADKLPRLKDLLSHQPLRNDHGLYLMKVIQLIKVVDFISEQPFNTEIEQIHFSDLNKENSSCLPFLQNSSAPVLEERQKRLIQAEKYLRLKFKNSSFWISESELEKARKEYDSRTPVEEIKKKVLQKKIYEAINLFIESLTKQIPFQLYLKWNN